MYHGVICSCTLDLNLGSIKVCFRNDLECHDGQLTTSIAGRICQRRVCYRIYVFAESDVIRLHALRTKSCSDRFVQAYKQFDGEDGCLKPGSVVSGFRFLDVGFGFKPLGISCSGCACRAGCGSIEDCWGRHLKTQVSPSSSTRDPKPHIQSPNPESFRLSSLVRALFAEEFLEREVTVAKGDQQAQK